MDRKPKILVVDDNAENRLLATRILDPQEYQVVTARSGMDALILLGANPDIDVMLLDLVMPDINGFKALEMVKANPQTARIKVIVISALSRVQDKTRAFSLGAADYIAKPVTKAELLARIEAQLELNRVKKKHHSQNGLVKMPSAIASR